MKKQCKSCEYRCHTGVQKPSMRGAINEMEHVQKGSNIGIFLCLDLIKAGRTNIRRITIISSGGCTIPSLASFTTRNGTEH